MPGMGGNGKEVSSPNVPPPRAELPSSRERERRLQSGRQKSVVVLLLLLSMKRVSVDLQVPRLSKDVFSRFRPFYRCRELCRSLSRRRRRSHSTTHPSDIHACFRRLWEPLSKWEQQSRVRAAAAAALTYDLRAERGKNISPSSSNGNRANGIHSHRKKTKMAKKKKKKKKTEGRNIS